MENKYFLTDAYELKVANVVLTDNKTGVEMYSASLETHEIAQTVQEELIKAGQENSTYVTLQKSKEIKVTLTDIMSKIDWQAAKMGTDLENKEIVVSAFPKNYAVQEADGELFIELDKEPLHGQLPVIYNKQTRKAIETSDLMLDGKKVKITDVAISVGDILFGASYRYTTTADVLMINNKNTASNYRCELHIPVLNSSMDLLYTKKIVFHKCSMGQDWTFSGSTEIASNPQTTTLTVLQPDNYEELGYVVYEEA